MYLKTKGIVVNVILTFILGSPGLAPEVFVQSLL